MFTVKNLKIKGFRGYTQEKELTFDTPFILLFGENHHGKSSTLNAIEWCLFGKECIRKDATGISERKGWEIKNRSLAKNEEAIVEMELMDENKKSYKISRKYSTPRKNILEIKLSEGQVLTGEDAEKKLTHLLKISYKEFLTTVYQHQENIRAIVTSNTENRDMAIDRLLGLSVYRNILRTIHSVKLENKQNEIVRDWDLLATRIKDRLERSNKDLEEKKRMIVEKGIKDDSINDKGALEIAKDVKNKLNEFASQIGFSPINLQIPDNWTGLDEFLEIANKTIKKFRSEMPDAKEQSKLFEYKVRIDSLLTEFDRKNDKVINISNEVEKFIKKNGDEGVLRKNSSALNMKKDLKEKKKKEISTKGKIISDAIDYLKMEGINKNICPVCGKETPNLLTHLEEEWKKKFEEKMGEIEKEIKELDKRLEETKYLLKQLENLNEDKENAENEMKELKKKICKELNREISEKDDTKAILQKQLNQIEEKLKNLEKSISSKQETLDNIQEKLELISNILDFLKTNEKKKIVEKIEDTDEFKKMKKLKEKMAIFIQEVNIINNAITEVYNDEVKNRIKLLGKKISDIFCKITNNPAITEIKIYKRNTYEFKDQNDKDLTPILNQGGLNVLALSIFLSIATSKEISHPFGFIILDDPSQSLGSNYKEKLVEVLDEVLNNQMVILSTMDKELYELMFNVPKITKTTTKYFFTDWKPTTGPEIKKE